jgi:ribonuclease E
LRLRDLGGLLVIDFIDMMDKKHINEVEKTFKKALSIDRSRIQLARISKFGLLELSRQKKKSTIQEISYMKCPYCAGSGLRPSLEYAALGAFRKIESEAVKGIYSELRVVLPHEIASYILNNKRSRLMNLEATFCLALIISGSTEMPWNGFDIKKTVKETALEKTDEYEHEHEHEAAEIVAFAGDDKKETVKKKSRRRPRRRKKKDHEYKGGEESSTPSPEQKDLFPRIAPKKEVNLPDSNAQEEDMGNKTKEKKETEEIF